MFGLPWPQLFIRIVIIAACVALLYVALNFFGIAIPAWAMTVFWIIVVAVVVIAAIKIIANYW